ncbi:hypothetical protein DSM106972_053060 [Dulcicalothrix desertica PCC 7102]|uniref:Uncharacterized protein n=1 Tax=Dulcicalothrix desertica PCC 7102 TaxID=232991 RepID=A0A433VC78_9CYAN|nr:hypothetical protein [Dulcicalothrix desertica]RUT03667.1 hypothetical protein DSM106972_053060 [Dulcicalothrix desertica PCC 7102]TWH43893.1 hypothetical protein CAL7102_07645 [Dulcicalothrix desertica PCC 7102]
MALVLTHPQFRVLIHARTRVHSARIYFPALFLAEFHSIVVQWLRRQEIFFDEKDLKLYSDGSFRVYFSTLSSPKIEYEKLIAMLEQQSGENLG